MRSSGRIVVAAAMALGTVASGQGTTSSQSRRSRYTPTETRLVGQALLNRQIAKYGVATDPARERDVAAVVQALKDAASIPELTITPTIVNNTDVNASALPGGFLVVNVGLLDAVAELARRDAPTDSGRQRRRAMAYAASVLSHEIAHVSLGHTDEIMDRLRRKGFRLQLRDTLPTTEAQSALAAALSDTAFVANQQHARDLELAADATGAMYLLRARWEIQDAMDLFRWFDAYERNAGTTAARNLTWVRSHPRSSVREASLEALRAKLKLRQAEFDDALTLVANGVMLDTAIVMLDGVLADFPGILAARHARAAALHRKWLATVPIDRLRVRGSIPVYEARFLTEIRGDAGDSATLGRARRAYAAVLAQRPLPYTLSNLAVLDAYAGSMAVARQRADSATAMSPDDPEILNNLGVVAYLGGRYRDAKTSFARAASFATDDDATVGQAIRYNLGIAFAAAGDTAKARDEMRRYVALDSKSAWGRRAEQFLRTGGLTTSTRAATPRATTAEGPKISGVRLGDSKAAVIGVLGRPDNREDQGTRSVWHYGTRGLTLAISDETGVALIRMTSAAAGEVDGVHVGDASAVARARWGSGRRMTDLVRFDRDGWIVTCREQQGVIREIAATAER